MSEQVPELTAAAAAEAMREGRVGAAEFAAALMQQIEAMEGSVKAFVQFDAGHLAGQAERADETHRAGGAQGPLHGVPVAVADLFDTVDFPTEDGTPLHAGRKPRLDATAVSRLRESGALLLGKTAVSELGVGQAPATRNPLANDLPAGSGSAGAAAAVAAGMAPLGLGNQSDSGVIGPASRCGVYGFKPSHGTISRKGMLRLSDELDQPGIFARSLEDAALLAECLAGFDREDPATRPTARPRLLEIARSDPPLPPRLAFVPSPFWEDASEATQAAFEELADALGQQIERFDLPATYAEAARLSRVILETDAALALASEFADAKSGLSAELSALIQRGREHSAFDYGRARRFAETVSQVFDEAFFAYEAFVTPAIAGPDAPAGSDGQFCAIWTLCGLPCVTLPLLQDEGGRPIGVQLVGAKGNDARLLRTARWLAGQAFD